MIGTIHALAREVIRSVDGSNRPMSRYAPPERNQPRNLERDEFLTKALKQVLHNEPHLEIEIAVWHGERKPKLSREDGEALEYMVLHKDDSMVQVRSLGEAMIGWILWRYRIPFEYEAAYREDKKGSMYRPYHPDFRIGPARRLRLGTFQAWAVLD